MGKATAGVGLLENRDPVAEEGCEWSLGHPLIPLPFMNNRREKGRVAYFSCPGFELLLYLSPSPSSPPIKGGEKHEHEQKPK